MKKVLVLVANYPNNDGGVSLMYVHTRNKYYVQHEIDVTVLNFKAKQGYVKDKIKVISLSEYKKENIVYDTLIVHAPNLRNHYRFLIKYGCRFTHIMFFFHGHEVLKINQTYPKPYNYLKKNGYIRLKLQDVYDVYKLATWRRYLPRVAYKSDFIFVSNNFYSEFKEFTGLNDDKLLNHVHIINNSVGKIFEEESYNLETEKKYDFVTIRNMLDDSVYCIDLLCELAEHNPQKNFLLIGKGHYFEYNEKPINIEWIDRFLNHDEMLSFLDSSRCALMLTRRDTQGVMTCELVAYGIPVITSDLPICHEIFGDSVSYFNNIGENLEVEFNNKMLKIVETRYYQNNTILKEVNLIKKLAL